MLRAAEMCTAQIQGCLFFWRRRKYYWLISFSIGSCCNRKYMYVYKQPYELVLIEVLEHLIFVLIEDLED